MVLLSGVDNDFFWSGFYDDPFRLIGIKEIYLAPGSEAAIEPHPEWVTPETAYLATGHEGLGITTSLATARLLVDQLVVRAPSIPFEPYLPSRSLSAEHVHA